MAFIIDEQLRSNCRNNKSFEFDILQTDVFDDPSTFNGDIPVYRDHLKSGSERFELPFSEKDDADLCLFKDCGMHMVDFIGL